jgi:hypothetical protein
MPALRFACPVYGRVLLTPRSQALRTTSISWPIENLPIWNRGLRMSDQDAERKRQEEERRTRESERKRREDEEYQRKKSDDDELEIVVKEPD